MVIMIALIVDVYLMHEIIIKHYERLCKHKCRAKLKSAY